VPSEALAQRRFLGTAAGQDEVQARVLRARREEGVRQQVDALLLRKRPA